MAFDRQTQRSLLSAILGEPEADAPRLVYADWLEEQGDQLAELVRVQVALDKLEEGHPKRERLEGREAELVRDLPFDRPPRLPSQSWRADRPVFPDWTYGINRGLVTLYLHALPPKADAVAQPPRAWVERFGWFLVRVERASVWESADPLQQGMTAQWSTP
jgi:uncharacterized protein (TIGR02996 family)